MNKSKTINSADEWFRIVPKKIKDWMKRACTKQGFADCSYFDLVGFTYECYRIRISNNCARELQEHYRKES